jgi:drug/metabolite transporter (DMT)-like permease
MLRGSVIVFTSIFSVVFLGRKLHRYHWVGIVLVVSGTAVVGAQSRLPSMNGCVQEASSGSTTASNALIGNILVIVAQLIVAVQASA